MKNKNDVSTRAKKTAKRGIFSATKGVIRYNIGEEAYKNICNLTPIWENVTF